MVEDEDAVLKFVVTGLRHSRDTVLAASGGADAIELMRQHAARIDFGDRRRHAGMNGRELAEAMQRWREDLRVLFMSRCTGDAVMRCGVQASSVEFLQKPFSLEALLAKVHELLPPGALAA